MTAQGSPARPTSLWMLAALLGSVLALHAQTRPSAQFTQLPDAYGPYSGHFLSGGRGLTKPLPAADPLLSPQAPWTLSVWMEPDATPQRGVLLAGAGDPTSTDFRFFALVDGKPALLLGKDTAIVSVAPWAMGVQHYLAATYDGRLARFFVDGTETGHASLNAGPIQPQLELAPVQPSCSTLPCPHFGGRIQLTLERRALSPTEIDNQAKNRPDFSLVLFEEGSKPWPLQTVQFAGNLAPQDPSTMPHRNAPFSAPKAETPPPANTTLKPIADHDWALTGGWSLLEAPKVTATPEQISTPGFASKNWLPASVPGTVLSTFVARGIYPEPDFGFDNLAIPESLNKQDYWYRAEFRSPDPNSRQHRFLILDGINYQAAVWLNGRRLGTVTGAFNRGVFDVTQVLHTNGPNALAIRVSPPPHPGIPNVQSIVFGAGLNGGAMAIDGPTFMATEGWDWMPPVRDRNTGVWQQVHLLESGEVSLGDPQVVTHLPLPDITQADLTLTVPFHNLSAQPVTGEISASFEGVFVHKPITLQPGDTTVTLSPKDFTQLHLDHPRLWWPNGYGNPDLYHLRLAFTINGQVSIEKSLAFGVRELSYEVSLLDNAGALRRVDYAPTLSRDQPHSAVDVTHEGMRQVPDGWAASIAPGQDASPAFHTLVDTRATPYLTLKVNGIRIAARGGSWGMDDSRKRVSRDRLDPLFRLNRDANLNIIRNWQGQNTEETFYQLADEYGMMVWNDFWEVTTDSNAEAEDPQLFIANARDTILRFRNHPSIVMWCGRNEGVPQPILNKGLIELTHTLDGTRYYSPSSNQINLQTSGPYTYQDPEAYYTTVDPGFAVEVGTPSLPTLEWFSRWLPEADRWPISDDWAYHNWHPHDQLNQHMEAQFGAATSLEDYERKAQMMNYVDYRAIFEGFNAHLWAPNTGRLLWMTIPAWPSMLWGILSSDYDTQASFYATRKACEPIHVQLDLATNDVAVVNTTRQSLRDLRVTADVLSLDNKPLLHRAIVLDAHTDETTVALHLELAPLLGEDTALVHLQLHSATGEPLSENVYWRAASDVGYRALNHLAPTQVIVSAHLEPASSSGERRIRVTLKNTGPVAALNTKLVTVDGNGIPLLPVFYSDNYVSLLPGEERSLTIDLPASLANRTIGLRLRGWNVVQSSTPVL